MADGKVKLFVGARCMRRDARVTSVIERGKFIHDDYPYSFKTNDGRTYTEDGVYRFGWFNSVDIVKVLNPESDPDIGQHSSQAVTDSRTAPPALPDNLRECWERCAFGFKPSPEELRALWSLAGFPLPSPRRRCNDCNCTGRVDGGSCPTCGSSGYLPVEDWDGCFPLGG